MQEWKEITWICRGWKVMDRKNIKKTNWTLWIGRRKVIDRKYEGGKKFEGNEKVTRKKRKKERRRRRIFEEGTLILEEGKSKKMIFLGRSMGIEE